MDRIQYFHSAFLGTVLHIISFGFQNYTHAIILCVPLKFVSTFILTHGVGQFNMYMNRKYIPDIVERQQKTD